MNYQTFLPEPEVSRFVKFYWVLEGDLGSDKIFSHRLFADASPTLVFHYRNSFREMDNGDMGLKFPSSLIHGLSDHYQDMQGSGSFGIFGVYLYPTAIPFLFNTTGRELRNKFAGLEDLMGLSGRILDQKVNGANSTRERIDAVSSFIKTCIKRSEKTNQLLEGCLAFINNNVSECTVSALSNHSGYSNRHLERLFKEYLGINPKLYSRILRFQKSTLLYERGLLNNLTGIAYHMGYSDQSHFGRDFKHFSGLRPSSYFRDKLSIAEGFVRFD